MTINVIYKSTYPTMMWYSWSLPRGFGDATPFSAASNRLGALGRCLNTNPMWVELLQLVRSKEIWTSGRGRWAVSAVLCLKSLEKLGMPSAFQICHCIDCIHCRILPSLNWTAHCVYCISCTAFTCTSWIHGSHRIDRIESTHVIHSFYWVECTCCNPGAFKLRSLRRGVPSAWSKPSTLHSSVSKLSSVWSPANQVVVQRGLKRCECI